MNTPTVIMPNHKKWFNFIEKCEKENVNPDDFILNIIDDWVAGRFEVEEVKAKKDKKEVPVVMEQVKEVIGEPVVEPQPIKKENVKELAERFGIINAMKQELENQGQLTPGELQEYSEVVAEFTAIKKKLLSGV